jgi:cytochrome c oxidase accessory protein FixG
MTDQHPLPAPQPLPDPASPSPKQAPNQNDVEQFLYAKQAKIYPRQVSGIFATWRVIAVIALLGIYYGLPWVQWHGRQAVLFDLPARKFYVFDWVFWPQDFFYLTLLLIIAAFALFFFTSLAGRLWCGYACPQTVWTEIFVWLEQKIQGDRPRQMKLDKQPWNREKLLKKGSTQLIWLLFSLFTGYTFVGYFTPIRELSAAIANFGLSPWEIFWILFYGFATYLNAGWMREQVCIYMCPYARFQSAMFDKNTLVIAYDAKRGEPRGKRKRSANPRDKGLGDCIDCTMCVQVCPTGIDIRDGLQYQCIACAACIDACDDVMNKMGYAPGLVRYSTENAMEGRPVHILRPRVALYSVLLVTLVLGLFYSINNRIPVRLDVIRDRLSLYQETSQGLIENDYTLKILNMDEAAHSYQLEVEGIENAKLIGVPPSIAVPSGEVVAFPVEVRIDPVDLNSPNSEIRFRITADDTPGLAATQESRFLAPTDI